MDAFALLVGHLLGDFVLQNDWMAAGKNKPAPGEPPELEYSGSGPPPVEWVFNNTSEWLAYLDDARAYLLSYGVCAVHCTLYTLCVWACSFWWMPAWGLVVCWLAHYPLDRWSLAGKWMRNVSGQSGFADRLGPWSVIVVDNTFHLLTLLLIAAASRH